MEILKNFLILFLLLTPLISCKQHPERNEKMTDFISTGSTYWIPDEEIKFSKRTPLMEIKTQHSNYINTICLYL